MEHQDDAAAAGDRPKPAVGAAGGDGLERGREELMAETQHHNIVLATP
jgi:hypothetical protein